MKFYPLPDDENHPSGEQILLFVDGELPHRDSARIQSHLELCWKCRAHRARIEASITDFMELDDAILTPHTSPPPGNWSGFDRELQSAVQSHGRPSVLARVRTFLHSPVARRSAVAAAAFLTAGIIWSLSVTRGTVSAESILRQSDQRQRAWLFQPDKVLRWVVEEDISNNLNGLVNGKYRTVRWRNNYAGQNAELIRKYNASGQLVWARWDQTDGSETVYTRLGDEQVRIYPSAAAIRDFAAGLGPEDKKLLESYADRRERETNLESAFQSNMDMLRLFRERGAIQELYTKEDGRVFRLHAQSSNASIAIEEDVSATTLRRIRKGTVRKFADGRIAREEARTTSYTESTLDDFNNNDLSAFVATAPRVIRITPQELLHKKGVRP